MTLQPVKKVNKDTGMGGHLVMTSRTYTCTLSSSNIALGFIGPIGNLTPWALKSQSGFGDVLFCHDLSSIGLGFFGSDAPPLFRLNSWDVTSQQQCIMKQKKRDKVKQSFNFALSVASFWRRMLSK